ncbi:MAG: response regulator [Nitrospiraceae bacterium]
MSRVSTKQIRLLLVDDHEIVRVGLRTVLGRDREIRIVGEAATSAEAVSLAVRLRPDVVLLDVRLPDGGGVGACREILEASRGTRVLFLTSYADDDAVLAAIVGRASGYLLKEIAADVLIRSIKMVAAGQSILDPAVVRHVQQWMKGARGPSTEAKAEDLSVRESRIVALVAEGKTNKEIAVALGLSHKTVKNYLANIFQKLQISRRAQAAVFFATSHTDRAIRP